MAKQRKNRTQAQRDKLGWQLEHAAQPSLFGIPEVQETTCQFPVGKHSITDAYYNGEVTQAQFIVYAAINEDADWDEGQSKALSYADIVKRTRLGRSTVIACVKALIRKGWLTKNVRNASEKHGQNEKNTYLLTAHNCEPHQIPLDKNGRPKKCAIPRRQGSAFALLKDKVISWKEAIYMIVNKIESDWTSGVVEMSIAESKKLMHMTAETICRIRKRLTQIGAFRQLSKPFRKWTAQLFPGPYPKKRKRRAEKAAKPMRFEKGFSYSWNNRWRIKHDTGQIQAKVEGSSKWRHANEAELYEKNKKIFFAFKPILQLATQFNHAAYFRGKRSHA